VNTFQRVVIMAEMHGRDLTRRHVALGLLVALPLSFYLASVGHDRAVTAGGVGMAFAVSGATLFSVLSSSEVDQRLVLAGYRPLELLLGRLAFLGPLGLVIGGGFGILMIAGSAPAEPAIVLLGLAAVALLSIPFGLAIGAAVPRELEGTLVLIGVVGLQLATDPTSVVSQLLPFHGAQELLDTGVRGHGPILLPIIATMLWGLALFVLARVLLARRIAVMAHARSHR
jgi:hypothetical protein